MSTTIELKTKKKIPASNNIVHQTEDGTVFYIEHGPPMRLYVEWKGQKMEADLPGDIWYSGAHGNGIYFGSNKKVYKAVFKRMHGITISYLREAFEDEEFENGALCIRKKHGQTFAYRMCDDPDRDGILVDEREDGKLKCIHRRKAVYESYCPNQEPSAHLVGQNSIEIKVACSSGTRIFAMDSSPFIYYCIGYDNKIHILDTRTLEFLPPLELLGASSISYITGLYKGDITVYAPAYLGGGDLISARIPPGYESIDSVVFEVEKMEPIITIVQKMNTPTDYSSKFLNEFRVMKIRGEGAFGCVFQAINNIDNWEYAVKRIAVEANAIKNALTEVRAMAQLDHPNIVRYNSTWIEHPPEGWQHDADVEVLKKMGLSRRRLMNFSDHSAFIYIQMQLCNHSLSDWLKEPSSHLPASRNISRMKRWFKQIVSAVEYIHRKNLIHRDLKACPSNILFAENDNLKVCDLGIATERKDDDHLNTTIARTSAGTLLYMSPEQRALQPYSSKSDVFSLGLILAELCLVMSSSERTKIFDNFRRGEQCESVADERVANFIAKLTRVEPAERPSCREMLDDIFLA